MNNHTQLQPVFLLGAGRSGTKFLRDIFGTSSDVSVIPYDVGYVWRYGNEKIPHDELTPEMLTDSIRCYVKETLPTLIQKQPNKSNATVFIEKSVPNTLRPAFLQAIYPEAKFIHLIRDGRAVTESAMRLWQSPPNRGYLFQKLRYFPWKNYRYAFWYIGNMIKGKLTSNRGQQIWGPMYKGITEDSQNLPLETVCARQWRKCIEISLSQLERLDKKNVFEVRYEDLMTDSMAIGSICDFMGVNNKETIIENYESKVIRTHTEKWKSSLSSQQLDLINKEINNINSHLGYSD